MPKKVLGLSALGFCIIAIHYFIPRHDGTLLLPVYTLGFLVYIYLIRLRFEFKELLAGAIFLRLILFFGLPSLSDDFYRFLWDGQMIHHGFHPFSATPDQILNANLEVSDYAKQLYPLLNSKGYFTIYPPISQLIFWLSGFSTSFMGGVNIMRVILLAFEIGSLVLLQRLKPTMPLTVYAFNPLVILELTGSLHFEAIVVFSILLAIRGIHQNKSWKTIQGLTIGIATKLLPVILLPVLLTRYGWKKGLWTVIMVLIISTSTFLPLLNWPLIKGMGDSLDLFFRSFEFNASLFFIAREIGFIWKGWDMVQTFGPWLSMTGAAFILIYSWFLYSKGQPIAKAFSIIWLIQLAFATTVHPWYVIPLIALSVLSGYRFPIVWSFFIFTTYMGYTANSFEHPYRWIIIEYVAVFATAYFDFYKPKLLRSWLSANFQEKLQ